MRTLQTHFSPDALSTLDSLLKDTRDVRVFRRAQAVREVVKGQRLITYSALRKWVQRFAHEGPQGLLDRPRPGRPRKTTAGGFPALLYRLEQDP